MNSGFLSTPPPTVRVAGSGAAPIESDLASRLHDLAQVADMDPFSLLAVALGVVSRRYDGDWLVEANQALWRPATWTGDLDIRACAETWALPLDEHPDPQRIRVRVTGPDGDSAGAALRCELSRSALSVTPTDGTFSTAALTALVEHVGRAIDELEADLGRGVQSIDIMTTQDAGFLATAQGVAAQYPKDTLHGLFARQAAATPDAIALVDGPCTTTYAELRERALQVARELKAAGVTPRTVVGLAGERSVDLFGGLLGILTAGCVVCYLDPAYPPSYYAAVAAQARLDTVVITRDVPPQAVPKAVVKTVIAKAVHACVPGPPVDDSGVGPEDPAYAIFTSGTTGQPRGVVRPHHMHTSRIALEQSLYHFGQGERHLLKSPISFREFLWPLSSGGTAVIARPGGEKDDHYLIDLIEQADINVVSFVPSMLRVLVANPAFARLTSLRHVFVGGEALDNDLEDQLRATGKAVHNTYTLTEADYVAHRSGPRSGTACSIGRPLDMTIRLLDRDGRRVPPGCWGEIHAGGPGLATSYLHDPVATRARFVEIDGMRMFRTGDLARFLPDGELEYGGRRDLQVKVRGLRVEPSEVETVLRALTGVAQAAVVGYPDPDQGAQLVAYVQADTTGTCALVPEAIRRRLAEQLPAHFVPRLVVLLPRLPLLLSGKVDRAVLRVPTDRHSIDGAAPVGGEETRLRRVWETVLGLDAVGADVGFLDAGGDSLRMMVLRAAIEVEFEISVPLGDLVGQATIQSQAAMVRRLIADRPSAPAPSLEAADRSEDAARRREGRKRAGAARLAARARAGLGDE